MKLINLLSIISILLNITSCSDNSEISKKKNNIVTEITKTKESKIITVDSTQKDTTNVKNINSIEKIVNQDSVNQKKKTMEVIIDGKIYLKKNINDKVVGGAYKTHYHNKKKNYYYDIITGRTVYLYGKHGKIIKEK